MSNFEFGRHSEKEIIKPELSPEELQTRLEDFKKSQKQVKEIQICEIEEKDKELNIFKSFWYSSIDDWLEIALINPEEWIRVLNQIEEEVNKEIKDENSDNQEKQEFQEISQEKLEEYINIWNEILNEQEKQLQENFLRIGLIMEVAWMYKWYLQDILANISFKMFSNKGKRY